VRLLADRLEQHTGPPLPILGAGALSAALVARAGEV
jgi:hypothetical protein